MKNSIILFNERTPVEEKDSMGGKGLLLLDILTEEGNKPHNLGSFTKAVLTPGSSVGYHEHHGESEYYFILSGNGVYNDNGSEYAVKEGDVTFTPSGCGHGIANSGDVPLEFMTLVVMD